MRVRACDGAMNCAELTPVLRDRPHDLSKRRTRIDSWPATGLKSATTEMKSENIERADANP